MESQSTKLSDPLVAAVSANPKAAAKFKSLSPSCKREYIRWITEAKLEKTRQRRIAQAVEWIADGRARK